MTSRIQRAGHTVRRPANFWTPPSTACSATCRPRLPSPRPLGTEGENGAAHLDRRRVRPRRVGQDRPRQRAPELGRVPAPLPRRRRRLPPPAGQHLVQRPGHLRTRRDHLPRRLRPLERRLARRAPRRAYRLRPRPARPAGFRHRLRTGIRGTVPRRLRMPALAALPPAARPAPPDRDLLRRLRHRRARRHH